MPEEANAVVQCNRQGFKLCPIRKEADVWRVSNHLKDWEFMNAQSSMAQSARTMQTYRKLKWKEINWKQAEMYVNRLQVRIVKAVQENKWRLVKRL